MNQTKEKPTLVSLKDFIDEYQKTIAVIGVFMALAIFWKSLHGPTPYISYLCVLITVPLLLEVNRGYDYDRASWNLVIFIQMLYGIFFLTVYYVLVSYPDYLEKIVNGLIFITLFFPSLALQKKFIDTIKQRDYESRVRYAKALEEVASPWMRGTRLPLPRTSGRRGSTKKRTWSDSCSSCAVSLLS